MSDLIRRLREENETLREHVRQLEAMLRPQMTFPLDWHLSPQEQKLLSAIRDCAPRPLSRDRAVIALYGAADDSRGPRIVYVLIATIRGKLAQAGTGITIRNVASRGWHMSLDSCARLDAAMAADLATARAA